MASLGWSDGQICKGGSSLSPEPTPYPPSKTLRTYVPVKINLKKHMGKDGSRGKSLLGFSCLRRME